MKLTALLLLILVNHALYSQIEIPDSNNIGFERRDVVLFVRGVVFDAMVAGAGYQFTDQFSVALRYGFVNVTGGVYVPNMESGIGVSASYHFTGKAFNTLSGDFSILLTSYPKISDPVKGTAFSVTINKDRIMGKGLVFYYGLGFGISKTKVHSSWLFIPCLKIGLSFNI